MKDKQITMLLVVVLLIAIGVAYYRWQKAKRELEAALKRMSVVVPGSPAPSNGNPARPSGSTAPPEIQPNASAPVGGLQVVTPLITPAGQLRPGLNIVG